MNFRRDWNEFWFSPGPSGPLGLFRIALGALVLCWGVLIAPDLLTWFSERGVFPISAMQAYANPLNHYELDLFAHVRGPHIVIAGFVVLMVAALFLCVGFYTRAANIVVYILLTSFEHRDTIILNSGDIFMRLMCFYMMFSPAGASCSVDRLIRIWRGKEPAGDPPLITPWAQRLMQLQVSIVYISTFLGKAQGPLWQNGTAIWYPLHMAEMERFYVPLFGQLWLINILTYGTMATELSLGTLVWVRRLRGYILAAGTLLHLGIEYALNIPLFSFLMISSYLTFMPNEWIARFTVFLSRIYRRKSMTVRYAADGALPQAIAVLSRLDALHLISISPMEGAGRHSGTLLEVTDRQGGVQTGFAGLRRVFWRLPALWLVALLCYLPGMNGVGERLLLRWADARASSVVVSAKSPLSLRS